MKIKANNANSPIWKDVYSFVLPEALQPYTKWQQTYGGMES